MRLLQQELYFAELCAWIVAPDESARFVPEKVAVLPFEVPA
jgi:hypothetical protein